LKPFEPLDVARILRAMDDAEYASIMREHTIDVVLAENEARALILTEAGSRAWFIMMAPQEEFSIERTPEERSTTVITFGPTRGLVGDFFYEWSERLRDSTFERVLKDVIDHIRRRLGRWAP
jgi:hypothetical protein